MSEPLTNNLRVWWIPQIPGKPFYTDVASVAEGVKLMDVLSRYDAFQLEHHIKPDYSNAGGLEMRTQAGAWSDWYDEESGEDDPETWLAEQVNE